MTRETWQTLSSTGTVADLTSHIRLLLSGPDAVRYLNGQVTQDVRKVRPGLALPACVTDHKGKLEAFLTLSSATDGALRISAPAALRDSLPLRLEKYLIADDCALTDVTESTALLHFTGPPEALSPHLYPEEVPAAFPRFGPPGFDLWTTPERVPFWQSRFPALTPDDQSALEVLHGTPAWGHELTPGLLPPEARLEATAIDYHKGCYIGQEVISRIRSAGRVNRLLHSLVQTDGPPVQPGWTVFSPSQDKPASAGTLTRTACHPLTGEIHALVFLRRGAAPPLLCGPDAASAASLLRGTNTLDD